MSHTDRSNKIHDMMSHTDKSDVLHKVMIHTNIRSQNVHNVMKEFLQYYSWVRGDKLYSMKLNPRHIRVIKKPTGPESEK